LNKARAEIQKQAADLHWTERLRLQILLREAETLIRSPESPR
jgi:hypothetical protein